MAEPGTLIAGQRDGLTVDLDLCSRPPTSTSPHCSSMRRSRGTSGTRRSWLPRMKKTPCRAASRPSGVGNPIEARGRVDQIARDRHQVGLQLVAGADDLAEVGLAHAAGEVKIGEMDDRQAVERRGSAERRASNRSRRAAGFRSAAGGRGSDAAFPPAPTAAEFGSIAACRRP